MKTTLYIITILLTFSFNTVAANNGSVPVRGISNTELTPTIPSVATFEESIPDQDLTFQIALKVFAPVAPDEADFQEGSAIQADQLLPDLTPVLPDTAEFEDSI
jgi:hypothetical protein